MINENSPELIRRIRCGRGHSILPWWASKEQRKQLRTSFSIKFLEMKTILISLFDLWKLYVNWWLLRKFECLLYAFYQCVSYEKKDLIFLARANHTLESNKISVPLDCISLSISHVDIQLTKRLSAKKILWKNRIFQHQMNDT